MATNSSILVWENYEQQEEPGGQNPWGLKKTGQATEYTRITQVSVQPQVSENYLC